MKKRTPSPAYIIALSMGMFCLFLFVSHTARSDDTPLNMTRTIDHNRIMLSDVFSDIPKSKDIDLGLAPQPGSEMILNVRTLIKLASTHNVIFHPASAQDQITIKRAGIVITPDDQKNALIFAITPQIQGKFNLIFNSSLTPMYLETGMSPNLKIGTITLDARNDIFETTITPKDNLNILRSVSGRIERLIDIPVPRSTLTRGTLISTEDLSFIEMKSADIKGDIVLNVDQIIGRTARNNLNPGRLIRLTDTEIPVSIKRGQKINLIYKSGHLELTAIGRSMQDGRIGDVIRVTNGDSNKNLQGTILANNQVEIDE